MHISDLSDEALMLRAQQDELDVIGILYQRYSKKLFNFFLRLTANKDSSADLTQNVFYRILKYRNSYNSLYLFKTWMYQLARNCLNDYRETNTKHPAINNTEKVLSILIDDESSATQIAQDAILFRAIEMLPYDSRELLVMSKFQGLKYEEIASITGDTIPNIKVKVHRTIIKLKELYFEMENA